MGHIFPTTLAKPPPCRERPPGPQRGSNRLFWGVIYLNAPFGWLLFRVPCRPGDVCFGASRVSSLVYTGGSEVHVVVGAPEGPGRGSEVAPGAGQVRGASAAPGPGLWQQAPWPLRPVLPHQLGSGLFFCLLVFIFFCL